MKLTVEGMTCGHCVRSITRAIQSIDASADVRVDLEGGTVTIDGRLQPPAAKEAIEAEGYSVTSIDASDNQEASLMGGGSCCGSCHA